MEVVSAMAGKVDIRSIGGRLRSIPQGPGAEAFDSNHLLSNWVMERDEALLLGSQNGQAPTPSAGTFLDSGTAIVVPIPSSFGACGAMHLFKPEGNRVFASEDLEFMVSVAQQLGLATEWLQRLRRVETVNERLREQLGQTFNQQMIGECSAIQSLRSQLSKVATTTTTTLLLGESGTGKEVAARCVHDLSQRRDGPFVAVNCAAFNETLLESELFGHERGAFTGADKQRIGQFERANEGTVFLDEIGEMSLNCQAKVLRLLEGQPFERLGGTTPVQTDVRIIAATNRNLEAMVAEKLFREDLWFRLRVVELQMPPLRDRGSDILTLADFFLDRLSREMGVELRFSEAASQAMLAHSWPGNVRELRNAIERALVLCTTDQISADDLGLQVGTKSSAKASKGEIPSLAEVEQSHIEHVLELTGGNKTRACEILKIPRTSLYNKLKK
jgi:Nif-specific regulatory protein